jgi:hypothetical protein
MSIITKMGSSVLSGLKIVSKPYWAGISLCFKQFSL